MIHKLHGTTWSAQSAIGGTRPEDRFRPGNQQFDACALRIAQKCVRGIDACLDEMFFVWNFEAMGHFVQKGRFFRLSGAGMDQLQ